MLHNIRDSQTIFTWSWPVILNQIKRIQKLAKHFTEQKNYFYQYLFLEPQKKGLQSITRLDTFFTFQDFMISAILKATKINSGNSSDYLKFKYFSEM